MKKFLLSTAALCSMIVVNAANYQWSGDLLYSIDTANKTAMVASAAYESPTHELYAGDIVVPPTITIDGEEYTVNGIDEYAFCDYNEELTSVTLPETIITVGVGAFDGTVIKEIVFPNSVETIGSYSLEYSELEKISFGKGLKSIGNYAFNKSTKLTEITVLAEEIPTVGNGLFSGLESNITLYVPNGMADAYRTSPYWGGFKEYVELPAEETGISAIGSDADAPVRYFNLSGVEIARPEKGSIVIKVSGGNAVKEIVK